MLSSFPYENKLQSLNSFFNHYYSYAYTLTPPLAVASNDRIYRFGSSASPLKLYNYTDYNQFGSSHL